MRLLTFSKEGTTRLGVMVDGQRALDVSTAWRAPLRAPTCVMDAIVGGQGMIDAIAALRDAAGVGSPHLHRVAELQVLAPLPAPRKNVFCIGRNYKAHITEGNLARGRAPDDFPKALEIFTKAPTTVVGHRAPVSRHAELTRMLDYEVELGIVIGKAGRDIARDRALEHVFGYTVINDITARDLQAAHGQWFKGKSLDGTCPMGPVVTLAAAIGDPNALDLSLTVNGELRQSANTSDMLFDVPAIIAQLSAGMTLEPGDVIATGTPSGVGFAMDPPQPLKAGDVIVARVQHVGELETMIV